MNKEITKLIREYLKLLYPVKRLNMNKFKVGRSQFIRGVIVDRVSYPLVTNIGQGKVVDVLSNRIASAFNLDDDTAKTFILKYLHI